MNMRQLFIDDKKYNKKSVIDLASNDTDKK